MCGRFSLSVPVSDLVALFGVEFETIIAPRFNIAPSQPVAAVRSAPVTGKRELAFLHWGLIPSWAKDPALGSKLTNARSETAAEKPSFRAAFKKRRCLIPATGFYEWKREGKVKQPFHIHMQDGTPFALAGLWERWEPPGGEPIESSAILTTSPNELMRPIHDRMPVIVDPKEYALWLDPQVSDAQRLTPLLAPYASERMTAVAVSRWVNNARNEGPRCLERERETEAGLLDPVKE